MWNVFNFLSVLIAHVYITLKVLQQYLASRTVDVSTISRNTRQAVVSSELSVMKRKSQEEH